LRKLLPSSMLRLGCHLFFLSLVCLTGCSEQDQPSNAGEKQGSIAPADAPSDRGKLELSVSSDALVKPDPEPDADPDASAEDGERMFSLYVHEILESKCFACHGGDPEAIKGDLDLTTLEGLLAGGETSKDVLLPGNPDASLLLTAITWADPEYEMPPKKNDRLTPKQIEKVRSWVVLGAPWPEPAAREKWLLAERAKTRTKEGILWKTSGGLSDAWTYRRYNEEELWAYQPLPEKVSVPKSTQPHPVDAFLEEAREGVPPAPSADPRDLLRRASLDLIGLPPTPEEVDAFLESYASIPSRPGWP